MSSNDVSSENTNDNEIEENIYRRHDRERKWEQMHSHANVLVTWNLDGVAAQALQEQEEQEEDEDFYDSYYFEHGFCYYPIGDAVHNNCYKVAEFHEDRMVLVRMENGVALDEVYVTSFGCIRFVQFLPSDPLPNPHEINMKYAAEAVRLVELSRMNDPSSPGT